MLHIIGAIIQIVAYWSGYGGPASYLRRKPTARRDCWGAVLGLGRGGSLACEAVYRSEKYGACMRLDT